MFRRTGFGPSTSGTSGHRLPCSRWIPITIAAGVIILSSGGCGNSAHIKALSPGAVVLAFGDSLTSGKGAEEKDTYPAVLSSLTGYSVINGGHPGELSGEGLERLPSVLRSYQPALVILCYGGNDMLQKRDRDETVANLDAMIAMIKQSGADVILVGVPEPGIFVNTASFYGDLAQRHGVPYDDRTVAEVLGDASLKSDFTHPNADGYRRIAERVAVLIEASQPG